jgi:hypothetical protein
MTAMYYALSNSLHFGRLLARSIKQLAVTGSYIMLLAYFNYFEKKKIQRL